MKKLFFISAMLLISSMLAAVTLTMKPTEFKTYKVGETITFTAEALDAKKAKLTGGSCVVKLKYCGGKEFAEPVKLDFAKNNPATFSVKLDRPGFVLAEAGPYRAADGKETKWNVRPLPPNGGAAVEPEKIRAMGKMPADFEEFWQAGIKEFEKAEVIITPADDIKRDGYKVSRVMVKFPDNSGAIDGFLSVPAAPGKYPATVGVPGAGAGRVDPVPYLTCSIPAIQLWLNVHTFRTEKTQKKQGKSYINYRKTFPTGNYFTADADNRSKYLYRRVFLAVNRAVDEVAKLKEFNGRMAAVGNSQGGGTALVLGYLNKNVTCVAASVPALCDHDGWRDGRQAGWPQLHKALKGKADAAYAYFDVANFAAKLKVPAFVLVGFIDTTCSPSSVYSAYNNIPGEKQIFHMYRNSHSISAESKKALTAYLDRCLSK